MAIRRHRAATTVAAALAGTSRRYVLVWITNLGRSAGGGYRMSLAEAKLSA